MDAYSNAIASISRLLDYPGPHLSSRIAECLDHVIALDPEVAAKIHDFELGLSKLTLTELEEVYIQTFDLNPTCTLDLGWQLFGEDFNRGLFLVKIRQEMKRLDVAESHELPDHITQVLMVLSRMEPDKAEDFAVSCVLPAIQKTCNAVKVDCPYRPAMEAVVQLLAGRYQDSRKEVNDGAIV